MTLSDFATFSTAISGLAVTASLIYLALQTHQSVKHTKALIQQGRASRIVEVQFAAADADLVTAVILGNGNEPTPQAVKREQMKLVARAYFDSLYDSYKQYAMGLIDENAIKITRKTIVRLMSQPAFRAEWEDYKEPGEAFAVFVDDLLGAASRESSKTPSQSGTSRSLSQKPTAPLD